MSFKKGFISNPQGRPKIPAPIIDLCKEYTKEAVECLREIAISPSSQLNPASVRVKAAETILGYAYGKPREIQDYSEGIVIDVQRNEIDSMTDLQLAEHLQQNIKTLFLKESNK